ncbi:hypothetical protein MABM_42280 [Mycobacteroides abscessus]|uniref:WXG100 family type VII secretion target n=1 Tax=Mycobacteroides abscessus subsp. bolletii 50594 TaxID=1303024 RepID=A0AB33AG39_9MYCO|nr:hypothetical protein [Mycobacteroides abscessus]AGM30795.1 hypothetical protein MASS_4193 [Mycobacteroides abscessus subsp. bolletii 50594]BBZ84312.1 hypothetical protein MABM_42280 [Mycobacteroides abscessus]
METTGNELDNDSGLAVSPAEAMAAFQAARQHGENAHRIFQSIEEEQRAMAANWGGNSHGSYMNASASYNDEASEITKGLFNFITVSEEGVKQLQSSDDV